MLVQYIYAKYTYVWQDDLHWCWPEQATYPRKIPVPVMTDHTIPPAGPSANNHALPVCHHFPIILQQQIISFVSFKSCCARTCATTSSTAPNNISASISNVALADDFTCFTQTSSLCDQNWSFCQSKFVVSRTSVRSASTPSCSQNRSN